MPTLSCLLILIASIATAALAQKNDVASLSSAPAIDEFSPDFEWRGGAPQMVPLPSATQSRAAILCCRPRADRTLDCGAVWETPLNVDFGRYALFIVSMQQLTQESYAEYVARSDRRAFPQLVVIQPAGEPIEVPTETEHQAICDAATPVGD